MWIKAYLLTAAALMGIGLWGALSQMSIVMVMMGLELMLNGVLLSVITFWHFVDPGSAKGQVFGIIVLTLMAVEAALGRARLGLGFAQRGEGRGGLFRSRTRGGRKPDRILGNLFDLAKFGLSGLDLFARGTVTAQPHQGFEFADFGGQLAVARGLAGLALQGIIPALQLLDDFLQTVEIGFGGIEAQLRLAPAGSEPRNACRLFEHAAAVLRLGCNQLVDLALSHERGRVRPGAGVGEEKLDVLGPNLLAIDPVVRALAARDAAHDFQRVGLVEAGRGGLVAIVEIEGDLGLVAGRALIGACEDHVFHPAAAQGFGRGRPHNPAQGFEKIRLSAAIGTDDPGQTRIDPKVCRVHE